MSIYKDKGLLVIGGGILQMPALKICRELGIQTYLVDRSPECYSRKYADFFHAIDIRDMKECLVLAEKLKSENKIHGIFTQGTDVEHVVAWLAGKLGFAGLSYEAALNCNNKLRCRQILWDHQIDPTRFFSARTLEELSAKADNAVYPCYVKPTNNSGSRGITKVYNKQELFEAFKYAADNCYGEQEVIIEEEIPGKEYSVDTIVLDGKLYPCGISDRVFLEKKNFAVQIGSRTPSLLPSDIQARAYELMQKAAIALKIDNSAFKGDLAIDEAGNIYVIEFAGRTSGGFDSQYRKPLSFGINIIKVVIDLALGKKVDFLDLVPKWVKWSSTYSVITGPGIIKEINHFAEAAALPGVKETFLLQQVGEEVEEMIDCTKRFNYFISVADTLEELKLLENKIQNTLEIKINEK